MTSPRYSMMANALIGARLPPAYLKDLVINEDKPLKKHSKRVKVKKSKKGGKKE